MRHDDAGASQVYSFLIAGLAFVGVVGALLLATQQLGLRDTVHDANAGVARDREASSVLSALFDQPGQGWALGPDSVTRVGLANTTYGGLDVAKMQSLSAAWSSVATNGKLEGAEVARSLGLDPALTQFHLKIRPTSNQTFAVSTPLTLAQLKVAYVGPWWLLPASTTIVPGTPAVMKASTETALSAWQMSDAASDRAVLSQLGVQYLDNVYIGASLPAVTVNNPSPVPDVSLQTALGVTVVDGSVYPDNKAYIDAVLPARLANYNVLVIGSDVNQNALTTTATKNAIAAWVNAGGMIFVFGSPTSVPSFLSPLFTATVNTQQAGATTAPNANDPLLKTPYTLGYAAYSHSNTAWNLGASGVAPYTKFNHVLTSGSGAGALDVLAISKPGQFGTGRITLATAELDDVYADRGLTEALHYATNIFINMDNGAHAVNLTVDIGSTPPVGINVASASRTALVYVAGNGYQTVEAQLLLWDLKES